MLSCLEQGSFGPRQDQAQQICWKSGQRFGRACTTLTSSCRPVGPCSSLCDTCRAGELLVLVLLLDAPWCTGLQGCVFLQNDERRCCRPLSPQVEAQRVLSILHLRRLRTGEGQRMGPQNTGSRSSKGTLKCHKTCQLQNIITTIGMARVIPSLPQQHKESHKASSLPALQKLRPQDLTRLLRCQTRSTPLAQKLPAVHA